MIRKTQSDTVQAYLRNPRADLVKRSAVGPLWCLFAMLENNGPRVETVPAGTLGREDRVFAGGRR